MSTQFALPAQPDQRQATTLVKNLTAQSADLKIRDEDDFIASWSLIERHDQAIAKIGEWFDPFVKGLHEMHKMAIALRDQFLKPVVASKDRLLGERKNYRIEQERKARIAADRKAEELRKLQAKELTQEAKKLERAGDVETATVLREQAKTMPAPAVPVAAAVTKQAGSVLKASWKFAVENEAIVPHEYFTLDESKIRRVVNALGDKANIPGVTVWQETDEHSRAVR